MGFEPIKAKIGRQPTPQATQPDKQLCGLRLAGDLKVRSPTTCSSISSPSFNSSA
jgi:hypothetical protein